MRKLSTITLPAMALVALVFGANASATIYLENYNIDDSQSDAGWYQDNSYGTGDVARVETWSQSTLRTPDGINNAQAPEHTTDTGFFASSGYESWVYTDEYALPLSEVRGWGFDAMSKRESPREVSFFAEIDGVRWKTAPIYVIGDGEDDAEWRTYHAGFEPDSAVWEDPEGNVAEGLTGTVDAFGLTYHHEGDGNLYLDNFTVVPEPATLGLLAFGGLAVVMRRRRD
ncbi:MAG: PEP-CTERM sorting domain-containing protein [Phycisphaerae bacterium]